MRPPRHHGARPPPVRRHLLHLKGNNGLQGRGDNEGWQVLRGGGLLQGAALTTSLKTHAPNSLCFQFEPGAVQISEVFDRFSARPDSAGVAEWALHQASMEEVFLLIAHRAAEAHAAATSKAKDGAVDV